MADIFILPEFQQLKDEINKLKNELSDLILEHDELKYTVCKNIETKYLLEAGDLEYKLYEAYCEFLRLRRKKELIQAKKNRQEKVNLLELDSLLDQEFIEYKKKLEEKLKSMKSAIDRSTMEVLSEEKSKELTKTYRKIIKKLHPDLNPNLSEYHKDLFLKAVEAYKNGNYYVIMAISQMIDIDKEEVEESNSIVKLIEEKANLESFIKLIEEEIREIKRTIPYILKTYTDDEYKMLERKNELQRQLDSYLAAIRTQEEYIASLLED